MLYTIQYAKYTYYEHRQRWNDIVYRGMMSDYSWEASARKYEDLYYMLLS